MPTLPRYGEQRVSQAPLQTPRVGMDLPLEAAGGGQTAQAAFGQAAGLGNDVRALVLQARDKADGLRLSEQRRALNDWEASNLYDPQNGAFAKQGKDALGIQGAMLGSFETFAKDQEKGLASDRQRAMYRDMVDARRAHIGQTLGSHEFQQGKVYELDELKMASESSKERAARDPSAAPLELAVVGDNVRFKAKALGWGPEQVAAETAKEQSDLHARIIRGMISAGNDQAAGQYFKANQSAMIDRDRDHAADMVKDQSYLGTSQREATRITGEYQDEPKAIEEARKIADPKVQELTIHQIKTRFDEKRQAEKEQSQKDAQDAFEVVEATGSVDKIDPLLRQRLKPSAINQLEARAAQLRKKEEPVTNWDEYQKLRAMAANSETRQQFLDIPAMNYRPLLGNTEFKEMVEKRDGLLKGDEKALAKERGYRTTSGIVSGTLAQSPFADSTKSEREIIERIMDSEVKTYQSKNKGEDPDSEWVQDKIDKLIGKTVTDPGWLWDSKEYGFKVTGDYLKAVDKVPAEDRRQIEEALRKKGMAPTPRLILELFTEKAGRKGSATVEPMSRSQFMTGGK